MNDLSIPGGALAFFGGIGAVLSGAISVLFFRLLGSYEKRIAQCELQMKATEQEKLDWQDRAWDAMNYIARPALDSLKEEKRRRGPPR